MRRRDFLKRSLSGLATVAFAPLAQAREFSPGWISGFRDQNGHFGVAHIDQNLQSRALFYAARRLHGFCINPDRSLLVAPARRPSTKMMVFDLRGQTARTIDGEPGRHFFGHGCFSADGALLYTSESDYDGEKGVIGIYEVNAQFKRVGEFHSGGIGPHEIKCHHQTLIVANGGILTHPDLGRAKLNLETMAPNISFIDLTSGRVKHKHQMPDDLHQLSMRHMDVMADGDVIVGLQDQVKARINQPLVVRAGRGGISALPEPSQGWKIFRGYVGSVSVNGDNICVSSPRGNCAHIWGAHNQMVRQQDVCGIAPSGPNGFLLTAGSGQIRTTSQMHPTHHGFTFDNHCIAI